MSERYFVFDYCLPLYTLKTLTISREVDMSDTLTVHLPMQNCVFLLSFLSSLLTSVLFQPSQICRYNKNASYKFHSKKHNFLSHKKLEVLWKLHLKSLKRKAKRRNSFDVKMAEKIFSLQLYLCMKEINKFVKNTRPMRNKFVVENEKKNQLVKEEQRTIVWNF